MSNKVIEYKIGNQIYICKREWRIVVINGIATKYDVSNLGEVRDSETGKILQGYYDKGKYLTVSINLSEEGIVNYRHQRVPRLVAIAFIPIPEKYKKMGLTYKDLAVDHIRDGDEDNHLDNTVYNLQWLTNEENYKKAYNAGLMKGTKTKEHFKKISGENNYLATHTAEQAYKVRDLIFENKLDIKGIAEESGTDIFFVKDILYKHAWHRVIGDCDFSSYDKSRRHKSINKEIDAMLIAGKQYKDVSEFLKSKGYKRNQYHSMISNRIRALQKRDLI